MITPVPLPLTSEVHLWQIDLNRDAGTLATLRQYLATDELDRASRFHFAQDRDRFVAGRGLVRTILSRYLSCCPDAITFHYGEQGKPALASHSTLQFNLSHTHDIALLAITDGHEVGVDIERIQPQLATESVAQEVFSALEIQTLQNATPEQRTELFFRYWTLKEAYIKALGLGFSCCTKDFTVLRSEKNFPRLLFSSGNSPSSFPWLLQQVDVGSEYAAALAIQGESVKVHRFLFPHRLS